LKNKNKAFGYRFAFLKIKQCFSVWPTNDMGFQKLVFVYDLPFSK